MNWDNVSIGLKVVLLCCCQLLLVCSYSISNCLTVNGVNSSQCDECITGYTRTTSLS